MKRTTRRNTRLSSSRQRRMQYFVDVSKRGGKERTAAMMKTVFFTFKILFFLGICAGLYVGGTRGWKKLFWENPDYYLKEITYTTDGTLSRDQALGAAGLESGRNIFSYSLDQSSESLRRLPQVEEVVMRRYLPNKIEVQVTERRPIAWLIRKQDDPLNSESSFLLDARGLVFKPKRILPEHEVLPVIHGVEIGDLVAGTPVRNAEMLAALELLRTTAENPSVRFISIDVSKGYCVIAADQSRRKITFGLDDIPAQMARLELVLQQAGKMDQQIESVNLMLERNIPVMFAAAVPMTDAEMEEIPKAQVIKLPDVKPEPAKPEDTPKPRSGSKPSGGSTREKNDSHKNSQPPRNVRKPFRQNA